MTRRTRRNHSPTFKGQVRLARLVDDDNAIGITVERDAKMCPTRLHLIAEALRMNSATAGIYVRAIWLIGNRYDIGAQLPQDSRCHFIGSTIRAIHHDAQPFKAQTFRKA